MAASFRGRLFRLFLMFALIPSVILATVGAYLIFSSQRPVRPLTDTTSSDLVAYYNQLLFERIERQLDLYAATGGASSFAVDFLFVAEGDSAERIIGTQEQLSRESIDEIARASRDRERGFVLTGGRLFQFAKRAMPENRTVYGVLIHDPRLAGLLQSAGVDAASRSLERELHTPYLYFLAALVALLLIATLVIAFLLSARLSRSVAQPLSELSEASMRIAGGDFKQSVPLGGTAEMRTLIGNFNTMATKLDQTTAMLSQTQRVAAWRQVARRFAHELKNPLQPILVSLYRIEKQLMDTEAYDKIYEPLKAAADEVKHLTLLADRFSQLAKLPEPSMQQVDLNDLAHSVIELYREKLAAYRFTVSLPDRPIVIDTDEGYVREALHNLFQNALDATDEGGRIHLEIAGSGDHVRLSVADSGIGMDDTTLASARLPYFTTKDHGSGLGLAIVERAVTELSGQMAIESARGQGTRVTLTIPVRR
ncbi:MAG: ATP-binding protein [Candidatus Zixiibacteriota bacterium]